MGNIFNEFNGADLDRLILCAQAVRKSGLQIDKYAQAGIAPDPVFRPDINIARVLIVTPNDEIFKGWHSYTSDSYFPGHVFKLVDQDTVIVGRYFS